jgi:hypothetical protein
MERKMILRNFVNIGAIAPASARWSAMSGFARTTAEIAADFASVVHNLVMDIRDSYRPGVHRMRGPGPKWRAKHQPWLKFKSQALPPAGRHQLSPLYTRGRHADPT